MLDESKEVRMTTNVEKNKNKIPEAETLLSIQILV